MNPDTGHLIDLQDEKFRALTEDDLREKGYERVPQELSRPARKKLNGRAEATVSKRSGGQLSRWAAGKRKEKRRKRNKIAKQSRKANR